MIFDPSLLDTPLARTLIGLVLGLVLGSFTTMLAYRLPRGQSIVAPPSNCPTCQTRLGPRDLVPVFSYWLNKGRCRHCSARIGARYLLIELATTGCVLTAFWLIGFQTALIPTLALILAGITLATIKIEKQDSEEP